MANKSQLIVVSAVGLRQGGTLTILRECLQYLSTYVQTKQARVVAIVHRKELVEFDGIEYIEMPDVIKSWGRRLWCEYVTMHSISKRLNGIDLWLSLHDTTPRVIAKRQAVYCQTSFPFYKRSWRDFYFNYKIALFSLFTRYAYKINVHCNQFLVVQQSWLRDGLSNMLGVDKAKFVVAPPSRHMAVKVDVENVNMPCFTFLYASAPDCHKNFEVLCQAARLLEMEIGQNRFKVVITLSGKENRYSRWLYRKWHDVDSIDFAGYMNKEKLYGYYQAAHCLVHASKVETWGLPISEFGETGKPMLLANRPYAHATASGFNSVGYFNENKPSDLKELMKEVLEGNYEHLSLQPSSVIDEPYVSSWKELFERLLSTSS